MDVLCQASYPLQKRLRFVGMEQAVTTDIDPIIGLHADVREVMGR